MIQLGFRYSLLILSLFVVGGCSDDSSSSSSGSVGLGADAGSKYQISMADWKANPGCDSGVSVNKGYVSGLKYKPSVLASDGGPQRIVLTLPSEIISDMTAAVTPGAGQSIWPGIGFNFESECCVLNQVLQPVLWKGPNFAIPNADGYLWNSIWVYDAKSDSFLKSLAWTSQDLDEYASYGFAAGIVLHYYEDKQWSSVSSDSAADFQTKVESIEDNLFVNSQYVGYSGAWYANGNDATYSQISKDIIAIPAGVGASATLQMDVPKDGSFVTMTSTINIPGVTENVPESVLKVTEVHNPISRSWSVYNVFNMTPLVNLWHISNGVVPVIIEASVTGTGPDCAEATAEAWDGQIISVDLVPDALSDLEQQNSGNPITPIE